MKREPDEKHEHAENTLRPPTPVPDVAETAIHKLDLLATADAVAAVAELPPKLDI